MQEPSRPLGRATSSSSGFSKELTTLSVRSLCPESFACAEASTLPSDHELTSSRAGGIVLRSSLFRSRQLQYRNRHGSEYHCDCEFNCNHLRTCLHLPHRQLVSRRLLLRRSGPELPPRRSLVRPSLRLSLLTTANLSQTNTAASTSTKAPA